MPLSLRRRRGTPAEKSPDDTPDDTPPAASSEPAADTTADTAADSTADSAADTTTAVQVVPEPAPLPGTATRGRLGERRKTLAHTTPVLLLRAAHPRQGVLVAAGLAVAAAMSGRPGREVALVLGTVLVGQAVLGWHNDLVDRTRDAKRLPSGKPIADGYLDAGTAWFALICGVLLLVPLSVSNGVTAGCCYLASVAVGAVGNVVLRRSWLSWVTWAVSFGLFPAFLSYGGWGGDAEGAAPQVPMVVLAVALGVGVHVLCALPGLVADHEDGFRSLPLRMALKVGATRLLIVALVWTAAVLVGFLLVGNAVGLSR